MSTTGTRNNGAPDLCMIVGCGRLAIYRNASSARSNGTKRGYCFKHKDLALSKDSAKSPERAVEYYANLIRD